MAGFHCIDYVKSQHNLNKKDYKVNHIKQATNDYNGQTSFNFSNWCKEILQNTLSSVMRLILVIMSN